MSSHPRRSARLSSHLQQNQFQQPSSGLPAPVFSPSYSQSSSASVSSHPSPISDGLHPPPSQPTSQQTLLGLQRPQQSMPQHQQQHHSHAPLPSPSAMDAEPFFSRSHLQANPYGSQQLQAGYAAQHRQQQYSEQQQQQFSQESHQHYQNEHHHLHPHSNSMSQEHPAHSYHANPGQLPPDFLAEAAKRAQMACLMRDLGDVSL